MKNNDEGGFFEITFTKAEEKGTYHIWVGWGGLLLILIAVVIAVGTALL